MKSNDTAHNITWNTRNDVPNANTDYEQSTQAINMRPTPGTAPGTQLSGGYNIFVSLSVGPPTLTKQRVSNWVFKVTQIIE